MITKPPGNGQRLELERIRIHTQIAKAWRDKGYTWTNAQIDAAVKAELDRRYPPRPAQPVLPGMPETPTIQTPEPSTKVESLELHVRNTQAQRKVQIYDLLDRAGARGMTREELAEALDVRPSDVSQEVHQLVTSREAVQPFRRFSSAKRKVWVVVLAKHHRGQA